LFAQAILACCFLLAAAAPRPTAAVEIIAHRGASHSAPENTVAAVELAWQRGADAVEFDVWLTADRRIVALHDETTERTTGKNWTVGKKTFDELRSLDAGSWKGPGWAGEKIPSLEELLATIPEGKRVFIEVKDNSRLVPELERVLKASGKRPEQTVVISFDFAVVEAVKKRMPELDVYWVHGTSPKRDKRTGKLSAPPAQLIRRCHAAGLDGLDLKYDSRIDEKTVAEMRRLDLEWYVWTVNSPDDARPLVDLGVDGITTDRPGWLREQLKTTGGR
jgi:glycerophosphoryl diester phosphodiesterase